MDIELQTTEITTEPIELTTPNVEVCTGDEDIELVVTRKEFNVVGDSVYIGNRIDDTPQWLMDYIDNLNSLRLDDKIGNINGLSQSLEDLIEAMNIAKNAYTSAIITYEELEMMVNAKMETLNSTLSGADATIINLLSTKVTPTEAQAITTTTLQASINDGEIGALIGSVQEAIANESGARATEIDVLTAQLDDFDDTYSTALTGLETTVNNQDGIITAHSAEFTKLNTAITSGNFGTYGESNFYNTLSSEVNGAVVKAGSNFEYNSTLVIGSQAYNSGFGLVSTGSTGTNVTVDGTSYPLWNSEFWVNANKFRFSSNNAVATNGDMFSIDSGDSTVRINAQKFYLTNGDGDKPNNVPFSVNGNDISFNGNVTFTNVVDRPTHTTGVEAPTGTPVVGSTYVQVVVGGVDRVWTYGATGWVQSLTPGSIGQELLDGQYYNLTDNLVPLGSDAANYKTELGTIVVTPYTGYGMSGRQITSTDTSTMNVIMTPFLSPYYAYYVSYYLVLPFYYNQYAYNYGLRASIYSVDTTNNIFLASDNTLESTVLTPRAPGLYKIEFCISPANSSIMIDGSVSKIIGGVATKVMNLPQMYFGSDVIYWGVMFPTSFGATIEPSIRRITASNLSATYVSNEAFNAVLADISAQVDKKQETWYYGHSPTASNLPAVEWVTDAIRTRHLNDVFYNQVTGSTYIYSIVNNQYVWNKVVDDDLTAAVTQIGTMNAVLDSKVTTTYSPLPPNSPSTGDLWINSNTSITKRYSTLINDWETIDFAAAINYGSSQINGNVIQAGTIKTNHLEAGSITVGKIPINELSQGNYYFGDRKVVANDGAASNIYFSSFITLPANSTILISGSIGYYGTFNTSTWATTPPSATTTYVDFGLNTHPFGGFVCDLVSASYTLSSAAEYAAKMDDRLCELDSTRSGVHSFSSAVYPIHGFYHNDTFNDIQVKVLYFASDLQTRVGSWTDRHCVLKFTYMINKR